MQWRDDTTLPPRGLWKTCTGFTAPHTLSKGSPLYSGANRARASVKRGQVANDNGPPPLILKHLSCLARTFLTARSSALGDAGAYCRAGDIEDGDPSLWISRSRPAGA